MSKQRKHKNLHPLEITISDLELFAICPHCFWRKMRGYKPKFVGGGEQSHLRAKARETSPTDPDYLTAVWSAVEDRIERAGISEMLCKQPLTYHDDKAQITLKGQFDDCFFSNAEHRSYIPLIWKRAGGPREYLSDEEAIAVHAIGFLAQENAIVVSWAAMCFMTANAPREPWDYQVKPLRLSTISEGKIARLLKEAAAIARRKKAPPRSERCLE